MKSWHEEYKKRYAQLKAAGKSFFPHAVVKDTLVAVAILFILIGLAHFVGAKLEDVANPTDSTYNPRPEWYFLFLFQALKLFPGRLEPLAAVFLPGAGILILILLPFLDSGPDRHPLDRLWLSLGAVVVLGGISFLTLTGYRSPLLNPAVEKNPLVEQGQRLYLEMKCGYCHSINGKGNTIGPDLAKSAATKTPRWLSEHFRDPKSVVPNSKMPKMNLLEDEITALVAFIETLAPETFTQDAPKLFAEYCGDCHKIGDQGGEVGPDLSSIGSVRNSAFLKRYTADPTSIDPAATMPEFKGTLTDIQIEDLARFMSTQRARP